jgi:hypothetical protein
MPAQGDDIHIQLELSVRERIRKLQVSVKISTLEGIPVCVVTSGDYCINWDLDPGDYAITIHLHSVRLLPCMHTISLRSYVGWGAEVFEDLPDVLTFEVTTRDVLGTGVALLADRGVTWMPAQFQLSAVPSWKPDAEVDQEKSLVVVPK